MPLLRDRPPPHPNEMTRMTLALAIRDAAWTHQYRPMIRYTPKAGTPPMRAAAASALHRARKRLSLATYPEDTSFSWHIACHQGRAEARLAWREALRTSD